MAGLGYKDFTAGAVLTAAQVDGYLMEQAVMNFAGTAARGSALASVQAAGMVAHVGGGTLTVATSGSAWAEIYPGTSSGLVKIVDQAFSAGSAVSVNNCFTSTYANYKIVIHGTGSESAGSFVDMRLRVSGTDNSGTNYFYAYNTINSAADNVVVGAGSQTRWRVFNAGTTQNGCEIIVTTPQLTEAHTFSALFSIATPSLGFVGRSGGTFNTATSFDGFSLIPVTGTITGTVRVYGFRN